MLQKIGFLPGINKQITATGAEGQWIDCDNVRFRYGTPEKIGGWKQLELIILQVQLELYINLQIVKVENILL